MQGFLTVGLATIAVGVLSAADVPTFGRAARYLRADDVTSIRQLVGRDLLAIEAARDQVLPEAWLVCAYLAPDSDSKGIRRGRTMDLKSLVENGRATRWNVTSRDGFYAQVVVPRRSFPQSVDSRDLERPFRVLGDFSDAEIRGLIAWVRASPRKPPIPDDPDGTSHAELDRVDGSVPVVQLKRVDRITVEVWMGREGSSGIYAMLHYRKRAWHLGEMGAYVS